MNEIAKPPALPLPLVDAGRYGRKAILRVPAAAGLVTDEEMSARAGNVHESPVLPADEITAAFVDRHAQPLRRAGSKPAPTSPPTRGYAPRRRRPERRGRCTG